jgi:dihydroorotase (multifunctional complex type)
LYDLAIHGKVFVDGLAERWVLIRGSRIAKVSSEPLGKASATIELDPGQFLMPSATDVHVHLRDWSQTEKETVETGTKSALAGGVTTVAEMPNTMPKLETAELVAARVALLGERSFADFAVHASAPSEKTEISRMKRSGAFALKLYPPDLRRFASLQKGAVAAGMKVAVHAEEESLTGTVRSAEAERVAVGEILAQVGQDSQVRLAHLSTKEAAIAAVAARKTHKGLTIEVAPHHLFMDRRTAESRIGVASKVNPQLRTRANANAMRRLLEDGQFDFYATDHAPHTEDEKLTKGAPGFPGLEIALPLFLTKTDDLSLACRMYCERPAAYLGLKKGMIRPGYQADLVIMTRRSWKVDPRKFVSKGRVTPFAGELLSFGIDQVFMGGSTVYHEGRFFKRPAQLVSGGARH